MTLDTQKDDSESAYLVHEESLPTGTSATPKDELQKQEEGEGATYHSIAQFHEHLLEKAGFGAFQLLVLLTAGLCLTADAVEFFVVGYILPSAEHELCIEEHQKEWLSTISFIGMMTGALIWGLMGDRFGRRRALLLSLAFNGIFGVIAAFMPTYSLLMLTRIFSSIGIGGSLPIVYTYYSEFLLRKNRGKHLSFLFGFWALGGLSVSVLAWEIIPRNGATLMDAKRFQFGRWRKFLLICTIPSIVSAIGISFLPESPRFLLEIGRNNEAIYIYKQIFNWNHAAKSGEEYQLTELEVPGKRISAHISMSSSRGILREMLRSLEGCWNNVREVFSSSNNSFTLPLLVIWITMSVGYYGISIWLHEYTKVIQDNSFVSRTVKQSDLIFVDKVFNSTIENVLFTNTTFIKVQFLQILINHSTFYNCSFNNCTFSNIRTSRTYFKNCDFHQTEFLDTDLYSYKFQSCSFHPASYFFNIKE